MGGGTGAVPAPQGFRAGEILAGSASQMEGREGCRLGIAWLAGESGLIVGLLPLGISRPGQGRSFPGWQSPTISNITK